MKKKLANFRRSRYNTERTITHLHYSHDYKKALHSQ